MFLTTPGIAASGAANFRIMFSTYVLQGSFMIAVTLFQSLGKAKKATWLVLFRQIILFGWSRVSVHSIRISCLFRCVWFCL